MGCTWSTWLLRLCQNLPNEKRGALAAIQLATFVAVALVVVASVQGAKIFASGLAARSVVLGSATDAAAHLKQAQSLIGSRDLIGSEQQVLLAEQGFAQAQQNLQGFGGLLHGVLMASPQGKSASALLGAGQAASRAADELNAFYSATSQLTVNASGISVASSTTFSETIAAATAHLDAAQADVAQVNADIQNVDPASLPQQYQSSFIQFTTQMPSLTAAIGDASSAITMFSALVGPGPKSILVLFENDNELRANGGFIGTYGFFRFDDGQIVSQKISSVYDLDGQLGAAKVAPPGPFYAATDSWGLRDSNWFADFSQSAAKASGFYEETGGETPDAVVAITPDVFVDLLKVTGPVNFPKYGLTLTADSFRDTVQEGTSDQSSPAPKQMLADFAPLLMEQVAALPGSGKTAALAAVIQDLATKNILLYSPDPSLEKKFAQYNWAGTIAQSSGDYLDIVNSNIGGKKTDLSVSQSAQLTTAVQPDGSLVDTLTYTRTRPQDLADAALNIDYVRVLVPEGSTLVSASGFTRHAYYKSDGSAYTWEKLSSFTKDADLAAIDATASVDPTTGTVTDQEAGKTELANWVEVAPGQSATVTLVYKLPARAPTAGSTYSLTVQKQPGNNAIDFSYSFAPGQPAVWYTPNDLNVQDGTVQYSTSLGSDLFIGKLFK